MDTSQVKVEPSFLDRLLQEETELLEKKSKLSKFLNSEKINEVDPFQKPLLIIQEQVMGVYAHILNKRIKRINETKTN